MYIHIYRHSSMARANGVQNQVESYQRPEKRYLIFPCLTLSIIWYVSRVKWSNTGKRVALSPIPRCSSYWKESFCVALDYGRQLYLLTFIYIYVYVCIYTYVIYIYIYVYSSVYIYICTFIWIYIILIIN